MRDLSRLRWALGMSRACLSYAVLVLLAAAACSAGDERSITLTTIDHRLTNMSWSDAFPELEMPSSTVWQIEPPAGSATTLDANDELGASFMADMPGVYLVDLDAKYGSATARATFEYTVVEDGGYAMIARGAQDATSIALTVAPNFPYESGTEYLWRVEGPPGTQSRFSNTDRKDVVFFPRAIGTFTVSAIVSTPRISAYAEITLDL